MTTMPEGFLRGLLGVCGFQSFTMSFSIGHGFHLLMIGYRNSDSKGRLGSWLHSNLPAVGFNQFLYDGESKTPVSLACREPSLKDFFMDFDWKGEAIIGD